MTRYSRWAMGLACLLAACGPSPGDSNNNGIQNNNNAVLLDAATVWWDGHVDGGGPPICEEQDFPLAEGPPAQVMLVIDKSGSMDEGSPTKWTQMVNALTNLTAQFEGQIQFGLLLYPTDGTVSNQCSVPAIAVPVGGDATAIANALNGATPAGGTPTAFALEDAQTALQALGTTNPKAVILATDGGPNCNDGLSTPCSCSLGSSTLCCTNPIMCLNGDQCVDDAHCFTVLQAMQTAGIDTYVLGLPGTGEYSPILDQMAQDGGQPLSGGPPYYYDVANQAQLDQALNDIAGSVISCTLTLQQAPEFPDEVLITFDGVEVPEDSTKTNGWAYDDASQLSITIFGTYCDQLQSGAVDEMKALFKCPPPG